MDNFGGAVPFDFSQLVTGYTGADRVQGTLQFTVTAPGATGLIAALGDSVDSYNQQFQLVDNFSWVKGNHGFKFGIDHRRLTPLFGPVPYSHTVILNDAQQIRNGIARAVFVFAKQEAHPIFDNFSAYVQDTWKVTKRLTLDLGMRWEFNPSPGEANGLRPLLVTGIENLPTAKLAPAGTSLYKTDYKAFAPRLGTVYQLVKKPGKETIVRGAFGVYYDQGNGLAIAGFNAFPFVASNLIQNVPLPLTASQAAPPSFSLTGMATSNILALNPDLTLPYTLQWNFGVERSLGANQTLSVTWVGNSGRKLLWDHQTNQSVPGAGKPNPNFGTVDFITNGPTSDYESMQVQFKQRLSHGLQTLANYTWAHAIDEVSNEGQGGVLERGNASSDVRHNFSAAITYDLRTQHFGPFFRSIINGWSVDAIVLAQSGLPLDLRSGFSNQILADGSLYFKRPDVIPGQPFWIKDPTAPGGVRLNPAAFQIVPTTENRQGTLGRNAVHAPGIHQVNMAIGREFKLTEKMNLQIKAEAFNVFNTPMFWTWNTTVPANPFTSTTFGRASMMFNRGIGGDLTRLYEIGGPRSMQFMARFSF